MPVYFEGGDVHRSAFLPFSAIASWQEVELKPYRSTLRVVMSTVLQLFLPFSAIASCPRMSKV